jgi:hypothetical protein
MARASTHPTLGHDERPSTSTPTPEVLIAIEVAVRAICRQIEDWRPRRGADPADGQLAYSIVDLGRVTNTGRQLLYDEINGRRLIAKKVGRRTLIRREDAERWLANAPAIKPVVIGDDAGSPVSKGVTTSADETLVGSATNGRRGPMAGTALRMAAEKLIVPGQYGHQNPKKNSAKHLPESGSRPAAQSRSNRND